MWAERRAPSAPVWLLIITLHVAVLLTWPARTRQAEPPRPWAELRLIPARPVDTPAPQPAASPITPRFTAPAAPAVPLPIPSPIPSLIPPGLDLPAAPEISPPAATEAPHDATLRLALPHAADAASRQPALDDPRGNTPISRIGARIANDLGGDGRWVEERMDADFVRLRRGNTCINLHRARGAVLNPFNESAAPTAWGAEPAYRCERR
jgi:hypothetical protein